MAASASSQHRCVFVGNIPYDATEEQLIQICEEVGPVVSFRLVLDRETGKPKGYGFCEYKDEETALSARRNLQGYEINGRQLRVDFAENDKGADRNREQVKGRGGPGFTSTSDAHKLLSGPTLFGDSSLHQPIGHPLAATAASTMARALGGSQISQLPVMQNGLHNFSGLGNDPLTQYLAKMSRQQLNEIMSEMKALVAKNKVLAQQLLHGHPQLPKAIFQAQIMLGMVTPQMMQMANARQPAVPQPALQNNILNQNSLLVGPFVRPPESQVSSGLQNPVILQQSTSIPLQQLPVQPPIQHLLPPQAQTVLQGTVPGKLGITTPSQSFGGLSNQPHVPPPPTSKPLISQVQPPIIRHSTPGGANVGQHPQSLLQDGLQQSYLPPLKSQSGSSNYPVLPNGLNSLPKDTGAYAAGSTDLTLVSRGMYATPGVNLAPQTVTRGEKSEAMNHQAKRPKLEDGGGARIAGADTFSTISSALAQPVVPGTVSGSQMTNADGLQHSEKQTPQLPPEVESALLQQVMNLTPEQLSSLPLEQQQQVLQLQQMLVKQNL